MPERYQPLRSNDETRRIALARSRSLLQLLDKKQAGERRLLVLLLKSELAIAARCKILKLGA